MKNILIFIFIPLIMLGQTFKYNFTSEIIKKVNLDYLIYLPHNYNSKEKFPLVLFLHGSGERGNDIKKVEAHGLPKLVKEGRQFPFIIVSPQCKENLIWEDLTEELHLLLENIKSSYSVDTTRIYCTGLSMGGFGTWALAFKYPNYFAAIAPVCGGTVYWETHKIKHIPIWAFHGDKDDVVPIFYQDIIIKNLQSLKAPVKFTVYKGMGHNVWDTTYNRNDLYEWLLQQKIK